MQSLGSSVEKHQILETITRYNAPTGFYLQRPDGSTVSIEYTKDKKQNYGLVSKVIEATKELGASFPSKAPLYEGLGVYYAGYCEEEDVMMLHKGRISSIKTEDEATIFTIDGSRVSKYPGSAVFTYEKFSKSLQLIGVVISSKKAVHINFFENDKRDVKNDEDLGEDRGKKIQVASGQFKGIAQGEGKGPRYLIINGPGLESVSYKLTFPVGGNPTNPHDDKRYNKNRPLLYQNAIDAFNALQPAAPNPTLVPNNFNFQFYKTMYTATK